MYTISQIDLKFQMIINTTFSFHGPPKSTQIGIFGTKIYVPSGNPVTNKIKEKRQKQFPERLFVCLEGSHPCHKFEMLRIT
jgi:hypothetical protein